MNGVIYYCSSAPVEGMIPMGLKLQRRVNVLSSVQHAHSQGKTWPKIGNSVRSIYGVFSHCPQINV